MKRTVAVIALAVGLFVLASCGQLIKNDEAPRLLVAYVDPAGDVLIRGDPGGGEWVAVW